MHVLKQHALKQKGITLVLLGVILAGALAGAAVSRAQDEDQAAVVAGNNAFAFDLYRTLSDDGNLIFSPYSISLALAMTYGGARGNTEAQMTEVLHFTLPQEELHPAFQAADASLPRTAEGEESGSDEVEPGDQPFRLNIANALWGQQDFAFSQEYLDLVNTYYGAGLQLIDFAADPEAAREQINTWVEDQTEDRIQDLLAEGTVTPMTRLILTNAIYFKASWLNQFDEINTKDGPFTLLDGSTVTVPLMAQTETFGYASGDGYQAVALPYEGGEMAMLVLLPDTFETFEASLDAEQFKSIVDSLQWPEVRLTMPRWENTSDFKLSDALTALGMGDAFDPNVADFSGMVEEGADPLSISEVIHKAFVKVDETGTEAAAATAVVMETTAMPADEPVEVRVDRPFLYAIYDQESGAILFMGRVLNPAP